MEQFRRNVLRYSVLSSPAGRVQLRNRGRPSFASPSAFCNFAAAAATRAAATRTPPLGAEVHAELHVKLGRGVALAFARERRGVETRAVLQGRSFVTVHHQSHATRTTSSLGSTKL